MTHIIIKTGKLGTNRYRSLSEGVIIKVNTPSTRPIKGLVAIDLAASGEVKTVVEVVPSEQENAPTVSSNNVIISSSISNSRFAIMMELQMQTLHHMLQKEQTDDNHINNDYREHIEHQHLHAEHHFLLLLLLEELNN
jgi:hypothetical protein